MRDDLLDKMVGTWKVTGRIAGRSIEQGCNAEWVLNHQFLRIHFLAAQPAPAQGQTGVRYEALVFVGYSNMFEHYVVHWIDVFGGHFSQTLGFGTRLAGGRSIRFVFEADTPLHNTIAWDPGTGTWSMRIRQKNLEGKWTTFAEARFVKASSAVRNVGAGARRSRPASSEF